MNTLKSTNADLTEIKYVARILRNKLRNHSNVQSTQTDLNYDEPFNHDKYIERNFWGYVKKVLNRKDAVLPSFSITQCVEYFTQTLAAVNPNKLFNIPNWIPVLSDPQVEFDLDPPSYLIINKLRLLSVRWKPLVLLVLSIKFQLYVSNDAPIYELIWLNLYVPSGSLDLFRVSGKKLAQYSFTKMATQVFPQISDRLHLNQFHLKCSHLVSAMQCTTFSWLITL